MNNIPQFRSLIPPPPKKRNVWDRYSSGEKLMPTYNKVYPESRILPPQPPEPQEPRRINYGVMNGLEKIILLMILIGGICGFIVLIAGVILKIINR